MNLYLVKVARMKGLGELVAKSRSFIHGGLDELDALKHTREIALKSLKSVPESDVKTRKYLKGAYKAIYKNHLGTDKVMTDIESKVSGA